MTLATPSLCTPLLLHSGDEDPAHGLLLDGGDHGLEHVVTFTLVLHHGIGLAVCAQAMPCRSSVMASMWSIQNSSTTRSIMTRSSSRMRGEPSVFSLGRINGEGALPPAER